MTRQQFLKESFFAIVGSSLLGELWAIPSAKDKNFPSDKNSTTALKKINVKPLKVLVVGDSAVGKTCLIQSYCHNTFPEEYAQQALPMQQKRENGVDLRIFDTKQNADYSSTDVVIVCFSLISPSSFDSVSSKWVRELGIKAPKAAKILCGTKLDMRNDGGTVSALAAKRLAPVSNQAGLQLARQGNFIKYLECSALERKGVDTVFKEAVNAAKAKA